MGERQLFAIEALVLVRESRRDASLHGFVLDLEMHEPR